MTVPAAVELRSLTHTYVSERGNTPALGPIDLTIPEGQFVTVLGPSGCGKSTLLQILAGFVKPTGGVALVNGEPITGPSHERGVVFQQATALLPWKSVRSNVELGPTLRRVDKKERVRRSEQELARVGLSDFADRPIHELSGGMQQRVQIARVLANDAPLLLMDEPFGALDAMTRERLQGELRDLWKSTARTVVLITHSVEEAVALGSRIIVLGRRPGAVVFDEEFWFAASDTPTETLLDDADFHLACRMVRGAVQH